MTTQLRSRQVLRELGARNGPSKTVGKENPAKMAGKQAGGGGRPAPVKRGLSGRTFGQDLTNLSRNAQPVRAKRTLFKFEFFFVVLLSPFTLSCGQRPQIKACK